MDQRIYFQRYGFAMFYSGAVSYLEEYCVGFANEITLVLIYERKLLKRDKKVIKDREFFILYKFPVF